MNELFLLEHSAFTIKTHPRKRTEKRYTFKGKDVTNLRDQKQFACLSNRTSLRFLCPHLETGTNNNSDFFFTLLSKLFNVDNHSFSTFGIGN